MKRWFAPLMLGFGVTIAIIIGRRMSTDAMAVVIGVAVGVAASIPTSLLLVALMRRDRRTGGWQGEQTPQQPQNYLPQQPSVIVLNPADLLGQRSAQQPAMPLPPPQWMEDGGLRRLRVVGDDDDWME